MADQHTPDIQPTASMQPDNGGGDVPPTVLMNPRIGSESPGSSIGPYRLLEVIGEGGFGTVWLAERREPMVQRVAIKIIKPGMDSKAVVARFDQERQALAVMDHPNVAKVLSGLQETRFKVASSKGDKFYSINLVGQDADCSCPGFEYRGTCKHVVQLKTALSKGGSLPSGFAAA